MANWKAGTFIKIDRNILHWQWFKKPNHLVVWMYILISANYQDGFFCGVEVKRGDLAISMERLANSVGLSVQQTKTVIKHLKATGELTSRGYHDFTVFSVVNYDKYQTAQRAGQPAGNQEATNKPPAVNHNQRKKDIKKERRIDRASAAQPDDAVLLDVI